MVRMRMEMMRRQHHRDDRHASVQLHPHQSVDDRAGHEIVAVDASVVDKAVDKHGTRKVADAYLQFLYTDEGQEIIAKNSTA